MRPMQLEVREAQGWQVVEVSGVVDVQTAPQLRESLQGVQLGRGVQVVVDLDRVELLDSFGLGVLVGALKRANTHGGQLAVVVTRERLRRLFEVTGLDGAFHLVGSVDELLEA